MDINWRSSNEPFKFESDLINSMIALFLPDSKILFKDFIKKNKIDFSRQLNKDYLYKLKIKIIKDNNFSIICNLMSSLKTNNLTYSFFYQKLNYVNLNANFFVTSGSVPFFLEPKEIHFSKKTNFFGIFYNLKENFSCFKNLKIQETYKHFKLNSILFSFNISKLIKINLSLVKINELWYVYYEKEGLKVLPFEIKDNIIIFGTVYFKLFKFEFSKVKILTLFYLKYMDKIIKKINPFKECDCSKDLGFMQTTGGLSKGICWFDASFMALMAPIKLRNIFLKPLSKRFKIPEEQLFPCTDLMKADIKIKLIKKITRINTLKKGRNFLIVFQYFYKTLNLPTIPLNKDYNLNYNKFIKKIPLYSVLREMNFITDFFTPETDLFALWSFQKNFPLKIKHKFEKYELLSIVMAFKIPNLPHIDKRYQNHAISIIKCKDGWYYFDDNLARDGRSMIKLKVKIKGDDIEFLPFKYSYYQLDDKKINKERQIHIDLFNTANTLIFIYCL